jgi:hypothetical protein
MGKEEFQGNSILTEHNKRSVSEDFICHEWVKQQHGVINRPWAKPPTNAQATCPPERSEGAGLTYLLTINDV